MNVKSLLVLILALSIALPSAVTLPMVTSVSHAQTQTSVNIDVPVVQIGTSSAQVYRTLYINNPISSPSITQIVISVPKAIATGLPSKNNVDWAGLSSSATYSTSGVGPWAYVITSTTSGGTILPSGSSAYIQFAWMSITSSSLPSSGTLSSDITVQITYSNGATQTLSVPVYETDAVSYEITAPTTTLTAGKVYTFTVSVVGPSGVSVSGVPAYLSQSPKHVGTISPSSVITSSSGAAFSVNDTVAGSVTITASGGEPYSFTATGPSGASYTTEESLVLPSTETITVVAAPPTKVAVALPWDVQGYSVDYATNASTYNFAKINYPNITLTDAYGNPYMIGNTTVTLSATSGKLLITSANNGSPISPVDRYKNWPAYIYVSGNMSSTLTFKVVIPKGYSYVSSVSFGFEPASTYGAMAQITAVLNGTYSGTSNKVITSTFQKHSQPPIIYYKGSQQSSGFNAIAGKTITAVVKVNPVQAGVPVNFTITPSTVSASPMTGIAYTNKSGYAVFTFSDTVAGDQFSVEDYLFQPLTSNPAHNESLSAPSPTVTIIAGPPAALVVTAPSLTNNYISPLGSTLINVSLADQYGNPTTNTLGAAIQIQLSTSAGSLSASTVYILQNKPDTYSSGYLVYFTAPNATGPVTITATSVQPGISPGKLKLYVVTKYPMLGVISPANGSVVTTQNITVKAWAAPSPAAPSGTFIAKFMYSLNGAKNVTVGITSTNSSGYDFYSFTVTLKSGLNTIKLYATDSQGLTSEYTVTYTLSTVPPTPAQTIIFPTSAPPMQTKVAGINVINVTMYNNVSTTLTAIPIVVLSNSTFSWSVVGNPTPIAPGQTVVSLVSVQNIPAGTYTAKIFIVTPSGITISGYKTITVTIP